MKTRACLLALATALVALFVMSHARAATPRELVIELRGRPEHLPRTICVLGDSTSQRAQQHRASLIPFATVAALFKQAPAAEQPADAATEGSLFIIDEASLLPPAPAPPPPVAPDDPNAKTVTLPTKAELKKQREAQDRTNEQLAQKAYVASLVRARSPIECDVSSGEPRCQRKFQALANDYMLCQQNPGISQQAAEAGRVLFISLRSHYDVSPELTGMAARGNSLVVSIYDDLSLGPGRVALMRATIVGADYLSTNPSEGRNEQLMLDLVPRCGRHSLLVTGGLLSAVKATEGDSLPNLDLRLLGPTDIDISSCTVGAKQLPLEVVLPYQLASSTTLAFKVTDPNNWECMGQPLKCSAVPLLSFAAAWEGPIPPQNVPLRAKQVRFEWEQHCAYPWPSCPPDVTLPDAGVKCKSEKSDLVGRRCAYTCPGNDTANSSFETPFALPQKVEFRIHDSSSTSDHSVSETWEDTLYHSEQVLSSYVPPTQRHIAVHFDGWKKSDLVTPGQEVQYVEVRSPNGQLYRVKPRNGESVLLGMPGIGCTDHVSYRPVGDRQYDEDVVRVVQGGIEPARPGGKVRDALSVGLSLGAGIRPVVDEVVGNKEDMSAFGWADFAALYRRPRIFKPMPLVPNLELRAGLLYTVAAYGTRANADAVDVRVGTVPYLFVPMTLDGVWDLGKGLSLSVGLGGAFGVPTRSETRELAPKQWSPAGLLVGGVHIPGSPITVELMTKAFLARFYDVQVQAGGAQPVTEQVLILPLFVGIGARIGN